MICLIALDRIGDMLRAEELTNSLDIDSLRDLAIDVSGSFQYDSVTPPDNTVGAARGGGPRRRGAVGGKDRAAFKEEKAKKQQARNEAKERQKQGLPPLETKNEDRKDDGVPFSLRDIELRIPRGELA
jgi:hypothetical protein